MPRPTKRRCICAKPSVTLFEPVGGRDDVVTIGFDEFEVMRLLDYEAYSQEQCAKKMQVSRPTVTRMYDHARQQVVRALVEGKKLQIHGGDVIVCTALKPECMGAKHCCHRQQKGEETMKKIAVPVENGQVFGHFGKSRAFLLSDTDNGAVLDQKMLPVTGEGHGALAGLLKDDGVQVLLCGGIGPGAQQALKEAGITVLAGVSGDAKEAVLAYLSGTLISVPGATCNHHHGEGHSCGHHESGHDCAHNEHGGCGHNGCRGA